MISIYTRKFFQSHNLRLSYVDFGGPHEQVIIALHGHFGTGNQFSFLAESLTGWRLLGLDQRGHGWSQHALDLDYSRESYLEDLHHFITRELNAKSVVILGHSLGGSNAYQFAAKYPNLVSGLIIEDIGAENSDDLSFALDFPRRAPTLADMERSVDKQLGQGAFPYFAQSIVEYEDGWGFRFHTEGLIRSQELLNGVWWSEWNKVQCPVLLLHGGKSPILTQDLADKMIRQLPNSELIEFPDCSHTIHTKKTAEYCQAVTEFLSRISENDKQPANLYREK